MTKTLKNIIGWLIYLCILVGLVLGIPPGLSYLLKTPHPIASITSSSMWPALKKGDLVFIKGELSKEDIAIGDIIVYENKLGFTIHRVISKNDETVITKGDANNTNDAPVVYEEIVGKAVFVGDSPLRIPYFGNISILFGKARDKI